MEKQIQNLGFHRWKYVKTHSVNTTQPMRGRRCRKSTNDREDNMKNILVRIITRKITEQKQVEKHNNKQVLQITI